MKENRFIKEDFSKEVKFKLRRDGGETSRHIKIRKRGVPDRGNSMFPDKRKSLYAIGKTNKKPPMEYMDEAESKIE